VRQRKKSSPCFVLGPAESLFAFNLGNKWTKEEFDAHRAPVTQPESHNPAQDGTGISNRGG
jgi:hypothetical protein